MSAEEPVVLSKQATQNEKILSKIDSLETALIALKKAAEIAVGEIKGLKKQSKKILNKQQRSKKVLKADRKPHGFAVPSAVSDELCQFMGCEVGSLVARTDVTKKLTEYIQTHKLQNPENKRQIVPDETLQNLLGEEAKDAYLTHFTIQKYMNQHFPKDTQKQTTEVVV
jgi:upstream activation factor subunit UAF30